MQIDLRVGAHPRARQFPARRDVCCDHHSLVALGCSGSIQYDNVGLVVPDGHTVVHREAFFP